MFSIKKTQVIWRANKTIPSKTFKSCFCEQVNYLELFEKEQAKQNWIRVGLCEYLSRIVKNAPDALTMQSFNMKKSANMPYIQ